MQVKEEIYFKTMEKKLKVPQLQNKINTSEQKLDKEICMEVLTAFWERKKHVVNFLLNQILRKYDSYQSPTYSNENRS